MRSSKAKIEASTIGVDAQKSLIFDWLLKREGTITRLKPQEFPTKTQV